MKKLFLITLLILLMIPIVYGETVETDNLPDLIPYRKGNKWGFCDKDKNIVIECKYDWVSLFKDGFALVNIGGIPSSHFGVYKGFEGIINKKGEVILPIKYNIESFSENFIIIKDGDDYFLFNKKNINFKPIRCDKNYFDEYYGLLEFKYKGKFNLLNTDGEVIFSKYYDTIRQVHWHKDEIFTVRTDDKWGVIDKQENIIIPIKYEKLGNFSEGFYSVKQNGKFGFIDEEENVVIPMKYDSVAYFIDGLAMCKIDNKYGIINRNGEEIVPLKYEHAFPIKGGFVLVTIKKDEEEYEGCLDKQGKEVIPIVYDSIAPINNNLLIADKDGTLGCINFKNEIIIPFIYDNIFAGDMEGLLRIRKNNKVGFINYKNEIIVPIKYDRALIFQNGLALVELSGKSGFIDKEGKVIIPIKYDDYYALFEMGRLWPKYDFSDGIEIIRYQGKWGYIDKNGTEYWEE